MLTDNDIPSDCQDFGYLFTFLTFMHEFREGVDLVLLWVPQLPTICGKRSYVSYNFGRFVNSLSKIFQS